MISVSHAQEIIERHATPLATEPAPLDRLPGRILRESIRCPEDLPPFDRSAMDGYVICADDLSERWSVIGEIRAGLNVEKHIRAGEAMRIFTGARLPGPGLQVVMQEDVEVQSEHIRLLRRGGPSHVRFRGEDARAGEILLATGMRLNAAAVALLASIGKPSALVTRLPRILHVTTGDEIVPPDQTPGPGQIRNSNAPLISSLVREWGGETTQLHASDHLEQMVAQVTQAVPALFDLILISGGSGAGRYDFTGDLLQALGVEIHFRQVDVRPGKPLIFGTRSPQIVFGLPGNAMSHFVCFHLFVRTALGLLLGQTPVTVASSFVAEPLSDTQNDRETWWPVRTMFREGRLEVHGLSWKSSGDITCLPAADALIKIPAHTPQLPAGALVDYLSLRHDF